MKKVVRLVKSLDDVHLADGEEVEADVEARIMIGDEEALVLDLTDENAARLRRDLSFWIKVAKAEPPRQHRRRPSGSPGTPVCRNPTKGMSRADGRDFLAAVRKWAATHGRSDEIGGVADKSYSYGQQLIDDYKAYLTSGMS